MPRQEKSPLIAVQLRQEIRAGELMPGGVIPSERDLSERFAVSRLVIRKVLSQLTQEGLVLHLSGRGCVVAQVVRPLRTLLYIGQNRAHVYENLVEELRLRGGERGWRLFVLLADATAEQISAADAVVVGPDQLMAVVSQLANRLIPIVCVGLIPQPADTLPAGVCAVWSDRRGAGEMAARHQFGLGHRRLAFVGQADAATGRASRYDAVFQGVQVACNIAEAQLIEVDGSIDRAPFHLDRCLTEARRQRVSALVLDMDWRGTLVYPALRRIGWRVGADVSVIGVGGTPWAGEMTPRLATVDLQPAELAQNVLAACERPVEDGVHVVQVAPRLIPGPSSCKVAAG